MYMYMYVCMCGCLVIFSTLLCLLTLKHAHSTHTQQVFQENPCITAPNEHLTSVGSTATAARSQSAAFDNFEAGTSPRDAVFGSPDQRREVQRQEDRARKGWGGTIQVPAVGGAAGAAGLGNGASGGSRGSPDLRHVDLAAGGPNQEHSPPSSALSSSDTTVAHSGMGMALDTSDPSCISTCWPVSPGSGGKRPPSAQAHKEVSHQAKSQFPVTSPPYLPQMAAKNLANDLQHKSGGAAALGVTDEIQQRTHSILSTGPQQPSSGDSDGEHILSQSTTAEDTPRPFLNPAPTPDTEEDGHSGANRPAEIEAISNSCGGNGLVGGARGYSLPKLSKSAAPAAKQSDALSSEQLAWQEAFRNNVCAAPATRTASATQVVQPEPTPLPSQQAPTTVSQSAAASAPATRTPQPPPTQAPEPSPAPASAPTPEKEAPTSRTMVAKTVAKEELPKKENTESNAGGRVLHSRQDEAGKPIPGRAAAVKKQDFAALMAARQKKMREAEEADEGMYF